ncbi:co-chaperone GroES [Patescibacteria group bacterium]|nr:co-chaperone GroES [Patescibacteria group bacterium]HOM78024.1 co-chaperone GroES [bacterium]
MKTVKPLFDYLLIRPLEGETTRPSGIVIPDTAKEKPQEGKVISVGPGVKDKDGNTIPMEIEVGSVVMYKKWGGTEIKINGEEHILVKQEDILAVIEE